MLAVAPGIYWLRMSLPFQLDHINLWLLADGDDWLAVDTGFADETTQACWQNLLNLLPRPPKRWLVTHFHPDHFGLADWLLRQTGAELWMSCGEFLTAHAVWNEVGGHGARFLVEQFREHGLAAAGLAKFAERGSGYRRAVPALPQHYRRVQADEEIEIGGNRWRVMVGYGHSPEHVSLHCPALGVFIAGDMLLPRISTNISVMAATPKADSLQAFLASLARFADQLPADTLVLPAHGLPFRGVRERVAALEKHHADRLLELETACATPQHAAGLLPVLFPRPLDTHQTMFALGEAIAHLNHLVANERLRRLEGSDGVIRFQRATPVLM